MAQTPARRRPLPRWLGIMVLVIVVLAIVLIVIAATGGSGSSDASTPAAKFASASSSDAHSTAAATTNLLADLGDGHTLHAGIARIRSDATIAHDAALALRKDTELAPGDDSRAALKWENAIDDIANSTGTVIESVPPGQSINPIQVQITQGLVVASAQEWNTDVKAVWAAAKNQDVPTITT